MGRSKTEGIHGLQEPWVPAAWHGVLGVGGKNVEKVVHALIWVPQSNLCVARSAAHGVETLRCVL